MVSKKFSHISTIWGFISGGFLVLIALFQDEIKNLITSIFGVSNETFVLYAIIVLLIIGIISSIFIFIYEWLKKHNKTKDIEIDVERIDGVQAHIFFPKGTSQINQTLAHHGTLNRRRKLIVNLKVNPPKAYYIPTSTDSYSWKLIEKYPGLWISQFDTNTNLQREDFTQNWCNNQEYTLIRKMATKKDLLEKD